MSSLTIPGIDLSRVSAALKAAERELMSERGSLGHWEGELSSSALSTATAVIALSLASKALSSDAEYAEHIKLGLEWLSKHANDDGGWGDTPEALSNISTTTLCWAAFGAAAKSSEASPRAGRAEQWLKKRIGFCSNDATPIDPKGIVAAILERYGEDRTFSVPILTACALAGRLGAGPRAWESVLALPFELAAVPHQFFAALRLPVVSYALPALIAIGQARHFHRPPKNPVVRAVRDLTRARTLRVLESIEPSSGGFLEATPLTSFVVMSLAGSGEARHPVTQKGLDFLAKSQRKDGSWPIDTNLATWVTTLSINALGNSPEIESVTEQLTAWLLAQQTKSVHAYTHAAPGAWAWTPLPGGVPDADDTAGALLALRTLHPVSVPNEVLSAAAAGVRWLVDLQNRDGGVPTFCRGWGKLPFDRSSPDLTAHAIRAWMAWKRKLRGGLRQRAETAIGNGLTYLRDTQRPDGAWIPLWFGNQHVPNDENPYYGTARVVLALVAAREQYAAVEPMLGKAAAWLVQAQVDGSWGGMNRVDASVEETALALEALAAVKACEALAGVNDSALNAALSAGTDWLVSRLESGEWRRTSPIGFYFASLWYSEKLYPQIFTVGALKRVVESGR